METRIASIFLVFFLSASLACMKTAAAGATVFETMKEKCGGDIAVYCSAVTPREARLALCLYAHEDKVSAQCAVAIYDAIVALQISLSTISNYARTCRSDLLKFCATTKWGQGRLYTCLAENRSALTPECSLVLDAAKPELQKLGIIEPQ